MAITYFEPIPELRGDKAIEFEKRMKDVKPINLSEKELSWLKSMKIDGKKIINHKK
jgi:hypothetical protein